MGTQLLCAAAGFCLAIAAWAASDESPRVEAGAPRAFGYQVGDTLQRRVSAVAPSGWRIDESSLPRPSGRGQAIELRRVNSTLQAGSQGQRLELDLEYQVFLAPAAVRTIEIPSFRLRFIGARRNEELLVEAAPVTVAPLVPIEVSERRGLGEMQPDREPPLLSTAAERHRLLACGALALLLLGWLAVVHIGVPWRAARRRPFGQAWRHLRRLPGEPARAEWQQACRTLHEALNRRAGEVLFEAALERFVVAQPRFLALRDEIARFLQLSRREFFGDAMRAPGDAARLVMLSRRLRDAERGGA